jgi:hypothetical protein
MLKASDAKRLVRDPFVDLTVGNVRYRVNLVDRVVGCASRPMLICPLCGASVRALYLPPGNLILGCRGCHHLLYPSQAKRLSITARMARLQDMIGSLFPQCMPTPPK